MARHPEGGGRGIGPFRHGCRLQRGPEATAPAAADASLSALSRREKEVLELTREGFMPQEIARRLGRSVKTVEAQYQRVKVKLGLQSNAELREHLSRAPA